MLNVGRLKDLQENISRNREEEEEYISLLGDFCIELYEEVEESKRNNEELSNQVLESIELIKKQRGFINELKDYCEELLEQSKE